MSSVKKSSRKRDDIAILLMSMAIIILVNYISYSAFARFDLTSEKRFSLSQPTKKMIGEVNDVIFFKVYLEGEFPAGFRRLRNETREMLDEFRANAGSGVIEYEFINPSGSSDEKERTEFYRQLYQQGLRPTDLEVTDEDGISKKIIWPGAIVTYQGREVALDLLQNRLGAGPEEVLNNSIENLEYAMASAIRKLTEPVKPKIGITRGHGEFSRMELADIAGELSEYYLVEEVLLDESIHRLTSRSADANDSTRVAVSNKYDVIIIAGPDSAFSEKDKYVIDQYLMYGGKILWLLDMVQADMDSLTRSDMTMGLDRDLRLNDQLFTYGVRLNNNLVLDIQCAMIPLPVGMLGDRPRYELFPWYYFPLLNPVSGHALVNNLNVVKGEFAGTIDFVGNDAIKKEVLLTTSAYTKLAFSPVRISLGITRIEPRQDQFTESNLPVAVLLEGKFTSNFKGRLTDKFTSESVIKFREESLPSKMIVVADADIIRNHVRNDGQPLPLGIDRYTGQEYGNKDFIVNAVN